MKKNIKILITTNIPSPYFVDYANELNNYVDLTVLFELKSASDRDELWKQNSNMFKFKYFFLNAKKFHKDSGFSLKVIKYLKDRSFNRIIISNPLTPTGVVSLLYLRRHKIPFIIQSEGGFKGSGKGIKEKFKKYLMEKAEVYLTGMGGSDDYFLQYGATVDKLKKYHFTSLYKKDLLNFPLTSEQKNQIKTDLNIPFKKVVLYVGQFIDRKDIPTLLKAFYGFDNNTCLILLGGTETDEYKKLIKDLKLNNIIFVPFRDKITTFKYYKAADVFVLPTKEDTWGLVINEAMANGIPVISTNKSIAANQIIKNGINGFIVDQGDSKTINMHLNQILNNNELSFKLSSNAIESMSSYTIENMALEIYEYIK